MKKRPYILSIAGFDPSGGAGLLADCKTFEKLKTQGLFVCTANTIQTDAKFVACHWTDIKVIKKQINVLFSRFTIDVVKIGIIENWTILGEILELLHLLNPTIKIVVDPVLKASTDFDFHGNKQTDFKTVLFDNILSKTEVLTPNYDEIQQLFPKMEIEETIVHISNKTNLYLKGGHNKEAKGKDYLYTKERKVHPINPKLQPIYPKHGSGCVLSSAIAANLALGFPLLKSGFRAKQFTEKYLGSSKELLGRFIK